MADERLALDVNDRAALAQVRALAQQAIHARHMASGVSILDPRTTVIDVDVEIGQDTTIEPFTTIRGATRMAAAWRSPYLIDRVLEDGATVGPFAYLRPGSLLREGSKAGTFVEIGEELDVPVRNPAPLLYRRRRRRRGRQSRCDARSPPTTTVSTSTATTIGRRVRSSVHVSFVAPVSVGDEAYTGAGSTIDQDVRLGIARARQTNIEGYAERRARATAREDES